MNIFNRIVIAFLFITSISLVSAEKSDALVEFNGQRDFVSIKINPQKKAFSEGSPEDIISLGLDNLVRPVKTVTVQGRYDDETNLVTAQEASGNGYKVESPLFGSLANDDFNCPERGRAGSRFKLKKADPNTSLTISLGDTVIEVPVRAQKITKKLNKKTNTCNVVLDIKSFAKVEELSGKKLSVKVKLTKSSSVANDEGDNNNGQGQENPNGDNNGGINNGGAGGGLDIDKPGQSLNVLNLQIEAFIEGISTKVFGFFNVLDDASLSDDIDSAEHMQALLSFIVGDIDKADKLLDEVNSGIAFIEPAINGNNNKRALDELKDLVKEGQDFLFDAERAADSANNALGQSENIVNAKSDIKEVRESLEKILEKDFFKDVNLNRTSRNFPQALNANFLDDGSLSKFYNRTKARVDDFDRDKREAQEFLDEIGNIRAGLEKTRNETCEQQQNAISSLINQAKDLADEAKELKEEVDEAAKTNLDTQDQVGLSESILENLNDIKEESTKNVDEIQDLLDRAQALEDEATEADNQCEEENNDNDDPPPQDAAPQAPGPFNVNSSGNVSIEVRIRPGEANKQAFASTALAQAFGVSAGDFIESGTQLIANKTVGITAQAQVIPDNIRDLQGFTYTTTTGGQFRFEHLAVPTNILSSPFNQNIDLTQLDASSTIVFSEGFTNGLRFKLPNSLVCVFRSNGINVTGSNSISFDANVPCNNINSLPGETISVTFTSTGIDVNFSK